MPPLDGEPAVVEVQPGALAVIFGIIVLFTPKVGVITVIWIVGIWAILFGLLLLFLGFQLRKASKDIVPYTES